MIYILLDSSSDCDVINKEGYKFVPMTVSFGEKSYRDGIDIDKDTFYGFLQTEAESPKTSQPSPQDFLEIFEQIKANGDEIIYLAISSELSGTYQSAVIAKQMVDYDGIYLIDTKILTYGIKMLADRASQMIKKGVSAAEIAEYLESIKTKIKLVAAVDTLEYLYRGGRLSKGTAAIGELTGIKPILSIVDGKVVVIGKTLGKVKAIQHVVKFIQGAEVDRDFPVYTFFTSGEKNCEDLEKRLCDADIAFDERMQIGSTIGTHAGPGAYGVLFVEK